jgi:hypothetical protein
MLDTSAPFYKTVLAMCPAIICPIKPTVISTTSAEWVKGTYFELNTHLCDGYMEETTSAHLALR